jgi:hypothetical protein
MSCLFDHTILIVVNTILGLNVIISDFVPLPRSDTLFGFSSSSGSDLGSLYLLLLFPPLCWVLCLMEFARISASSSSKQKQLAARSLEQRMCGLVYVDFCHCCR